MKPFTRNLHGRNHRYSMPESKNVPKSSSDRAGSRTPVRAEANTAIKKELDTINTNEILEE